jgi:hypothetical protein
MQRVIIDLPCIADPGLYLKALDGVAELLVEPGSPLVIRHLVSRLLIDAEGRAIAYDTLPVALRDRVLAQIFIREFGPKVEAEVACGSCRDRFTFAFSLPDIMARQAQDARATGLAADEAGYWSARAGLRLRAPAFSDLARHITPAELALSLTEGGDDPAEIERLIESVAPTLSFDIATECPHCNAAQEVGFDLAAYLVEALAAERTLLIRETHLIASRYGWGHTTIMALPRADRRAYAQLITVERSMGSSMRRTG